MIEFDAYWIIARSRLLPALADTRQCSRNRTTISSKTSKHAAGCERDSSFKTIGGSVLFAISRIAFRVLSSLVAIIWE